MPHLDNIRRFAGGGMDTDNSPEDVAPNDYISATNLRNTGTAQQEAGYQTDIESLIPLLNSLNDGLNQVVGGAAFPEIGAAIVFLYNSAGFNQILYYSYADNTVTPVYTDVTDSAGAVLLPLDPANRVTCILVNDTFAIWTAKNIDVGYTNLNTLKSGGYGSTILWEDLSLIKPQCMIPPTGTYGSDSGQASNLWFGKLPQGIVQYVDDNFNYSTWSTRSKRIVPYQQNTPVAGSDPSQNNYIIWSFDIGSIRATTLNFAIQLGDSGQFYQIKSVSRSYVTALPNTSVDVATEIYEAYDPVTNLYSFVDYNNTVKIPVDTTETDLLYDYIWFGANACEVINGNIAGLGDWKIPYPRLTIPVTVAAIGYDPNIDIPAGTYPDPLRKTGQFPGASGSGAGDHKRIISISLGGTPHTGDKILVTVADIRSAATTKQYNYQVPSGLDGDLAGVIAAYTPEFPRSSYRNNGDGTFTITWTDDPYYGLQNFAVELFFAGATVSNSIESILDNTTGQLALEIRDKQGRLWPLITGNNFQFKTPSYAQVNGQAIELSVTIPSGITLPAAAFDAQWLITAPIPTKILDTIAVAFNYKGTWNAATNSPGLSPNDGSAQVGDVYQITTPASPAFPGTYTDLGTTEAYPTGGYVVYNGQAWNVLQPDFGDLTPSGNILAFSLNPLKILNETYSQQGINTILAYDFAAGDRCTLHYTIGSGGITYINNPCVDMSVLGYDSGSYVVKVEKPANFDDTLLPGVNAFIRLYSPGLLTQGTSSVSNSTVWYEIGERFTITNGQFDKLSFTLTSGGVYYKTRQFDDGLLPYSNPPIQTLATDFNYSDFYASAFWSKGRPRTYYDVLENTEQRASIITSQNYVLGSRNNGLNRFYPNLIYGEGDGQTSSSFGAIQIMWMRGQVLVIVQERNTFYIPVNETYIVVNTQTDQESLSLKLLNNGRYSPRGIGCGTAKESFCKRFDGGWFVDPNNSEPMEIGLEGVLPISGNMSKFFKSVIQQAYAAGKKLPMYYDTYYEEIPLCIQSAAEIIKAFDFNSDNWDTLNNYTVAPGDITANNGAHSTVSYDSGTGLATYTPDVDYVGDDTPTFSFDPGTGTVIINVCLTWTAGSSEVDPFVFAEQDGVPLSTNIDSNTIIVSGNDFPVPISVVGGEYSINGGAFTSSPGTVASGDVVQARVMSSASNSTPETATVTIDSQSAPFVVVTRAAGNFTVQGGYGITIESVRDSTTSGIPGSLNTISVPPNTSLSVAYVTVDTSGGGVGIVTVSGSPAIPGHTKISVVVAGVEVSNVAVSLPGNYGIFFPSTVNDPTTILITIATF